MPILGYGDYRGPPPKRMPVFAEPS